MNDTDATEVTGDNTEETNRWSENRNHKISLKQANPEGGAPLNRVQCIPRGWILGPLMTFRFPDHGRDYLDRSYLIHLPTGSQVGEFKTLKDSQLVAEILHDRATAAMNERTQEALLESLPAQIHRWLTLCVATHVYHEFDSDSRRPEMEAFNNYGNLNGSTDSNSDK